MIAADSQGDAYDCNRARAPPRILYHGTTFTDMKHSIERSGSYGPNVALAEFPQHAYVQALKAADRTEEFIPLMMVVDTEKMDTTPDAALEERTWNTPALKLDCFLVAEIFHSTPRNYNQELEWIEQTDNGYWVQYIKRIPRDRVRWENRRLL